MPRFNPLQATEGALPPEEVRFTELRIEPWPDGRRLRLHARLTPFQKPPDLEAVLSDSKGNPITSAYIVENIDFDLVITLHLRASTDEDTFMVQARVIYADLGIVDEQSTTFCLEPPLE